MKLTVYREATKNRPDGTIVHKGEDAHPYVDDQLIMVADGMGGAAAIYHQKFNPELFEEEKLLDVLFNGVFEDYSNETFVNYVTDSFSEFYAVKHCYFDSIYNMKKSGYFASRLVGAIVLHDSLYNEEHKAEKIFATLAACETEADRDAYLAGLGAEYKELIQTKLRAIAKNANLIYESSFVGLSLLGTTLCATLYLEHEDRVEALYLTAGDSRPYAWTEQGGLCQVLLDQEGADGTMTNVIKANEDEDFDIHCSYFSIAKPCVLFNASDGCFDSGKFAISQLAFEKLVLEAGAAGYNPDEPDDNDPTENLAEMSGYLTDFFLDYGRHDDSSTIAMKIFGYPTYKEFGEACDRRMGVISDEYFSKMEDLVEVNYVSAYEEFERVFPARIAELKEKFSLEPAAMEYCRNSVSGPKYAPYQKKLQEIKEKKNAEKKRIREAEATIENIVSSNYMRFHEFMEDKDHRDEYEAKCGISDAEKNYVLQLSEYEDYLGLQGAELDSAVADLRALLDAIGAVGIPASFEDFATVDFKAAVESKKKLDKLFAFFTALTAKKLEVVKKLMSEHKKYVGANKKLAKKNQEGVDLVCKKLLDGEIEYTDVLTLDSDKLKLAEAITTAHEAQATFDDLEANGKQKALEACAVAYWDIKYLDVIKAIVAAPECTVDPALAESARKTVAEIESAAASKEKGELQKALLEKYEAAYNAYVGG